MAGGGIGSTNSIQIISNLFVDARAGKEEGGGRGPSMLQEVKFIKKLVQNQRDGFETKKNLNVDIREETVDEVPGSCQ